MKIPAIRGLIDRRILVNYHIAPDVITQILPPPFRPKLINGYAIGGICLIRLKDIRPHFSPFPWGIQSENAAHRIAVEWDVDGNTQEGVYIPRRDTNSRLKVWAGGRLFSGVHHPAIFTVEEVDESLSVSLHSDDGQTRVFVSGRVTNQLPSTSVFPSLATASHFFEMGSLGYSARGENGRFDGLELRCKNWQVDPLEIECVESSYFENKAWFPQGSIGFDCALLMRGIDHEWHGRQELRCL